MEETKETLFLKSLLSISKANIGILSASTLCQNADFRIYTSAEIPKEVISKLDRDGVFIDQIDLEEKREQEFRYLGHLKSKYKLSAIDNRLDD